VRPHFNEEERTSFTVTEPQFEFVETSYRKMSQDYSLPFPVEGDMILPLHPSRISELPYFQVTSKVIDEMVSKDKMVKIVIPELNEHILILPKLIVQLPTICIKRIRKFFNAHGRIRVLDMVVKTIEMVLPEKNLNLERVLKILSLEEKESPIFFIHLAEGLLNRLEKEKGNKDIRPLLVSAILLKHFKLQQNEAESDVKKKEKENEDVEKLLKIMKSNPRPYTRNELRHIRETDGKSLNFSGTYNPQEFADLVEHFIEKYTTKPEIGGDLPIEKQVPEIIRVSDDQTIEFFIYREYLVSLADRDRLDASQKAKTHYLEKWMNQLKQYKDLPEMNKDRDFEISARKFVVKNYRILASILKDPTTLYQVFKIYENDSDISHRMKDYFGGLGKSKLQPYIYILGLNRQEIYRDAYATLPFAYRNFLLRLLLFIISLFKNREKEKNHGAETEPGLESFTPEESELNSGPDLAEIKKEVASKNRKFLPEIEKNYRAGGNVQEVLDELKDNWNTKIGEVRDVLTEKIDKDTQQRALNIYKMLLRSPDYSEEFLHHELKNMATDLSQNKYSEIADKKSLARYIIIRSIWILRQKSR